MGLMRDYILEQQDAEDEEEHKAGNVQCEDCGQWVEPGGWVSEGLPCGDCQDEAFHKAK